MIEVFSFAEIQVEFDARIQKAVYCSMATVDRQGRPRSRILHPIWDGPIGWAISWPESHKARHLENNPYVSLAYIADRDRPVYVDALAEWVNDEGEKHRIWKLCQTIPSPVGFDPTPHYGSIHHRFFGVLRFIPWRFELANLGGKSIVFRYLPSAKP